jgi:WYL_2, Sm-like SH3 beta-barrel fold
MHTTSNNLIDTLKSNVVQIKFLKVDGTERTMNCTLKEEYIKPFDKKTDRVKEPKDGLLSVWDIDNDGWRSFKVENLISYTFVEGESSWLKSMN